jgi:hypothetical protein
MTYHDCQGQTCRKVLLGSVSRLFTENMLYVGLSRAPSLESVCLSDDFAQRFIQAHPQALDFFVAIESAQGEAPRDEASSEAPRGEAPSEAPRDEAPSEAPSEAPRGEATSVTSVPREEERSAYPVFVPRKRNHGLDILLPE